MSPQFKVYGLSGNLWAGLAERNWLRIFSGLHNQEVNPGARKLFRCMYWVSSSWFEWAAIFGYCIQSSLYIQCWVRVRQPLPMPSQTSSHRYPTLLFCYLAVKPWPTAGSSVTQLASAAVLPVSRLNEVRGRNKQMGKTEQKLLRSIKKKHVAGDIILKKICITTMWFRATSNQVTQA